jgi:predicted lactoylglutathione lyase
MSEEKPNLDEEADANPDEGGESEDEKEFKAMFEGLNFDDPDADIEELKKKVADIEKGASRFFSQRGQKKEEKKPEQPVAPATKDSDIEVMFFETRPEAELVKDDLKKVAEVKGISLIQAWKQEAWLQEKAKTLSADETNKGRIGSPSNGVQPKTEENEFAKSFASSLPKGFSAETPNV